MKEYLDYDQKYPDLIVRLVQFFKNNSKGEKKIWEFCESYKVPKGEDIIQPIVVGKICDRLWERSILRLEGTVLPIYQNRPHDTV